MNPLATVDPSWQPVLHMLHHGELGKLNTHLGTISYQPAPQHIFRALQKPVSSIKVVVLGQDPYPTAGDAVGYAFATRPKRKLPASLRIIQKEVFDQMIKTGLYDEDVLHTSHAEYWNTLQHWINSGVLLLNTALTVETGKAGSHLKAWNAWTKNLVQFISKNNPCVWIMWGKKAQAFIPNISGEQFMVKNYDLNTIRDIPANPSWNYILTSPHPAAETYAGGKAGFYGNNHFLYANTILSKTKNATISWI